MFKIRHFQTPRIKFCTHILSPELEGARATLFADSFEEFDGNRKDDRRVFFGRDLRQCLKVAQLERSRRLAYNVGRLLQSARRLLLALGSYHLQVGRPK